MDTYTLEAAWEPGYLWCPDEIVHHIKPMAFGLGNASKNPTKTTQNYIYNSLLGKYTSTWIWNLGGLICIYPDRWHTVLLGIDSSRIKCVWKGVAHSLVWFLGSGTYCKRELGAVLEVWCLGYICGVRWALSLWSPCAELLSSELHLSWQRDAGEKSCEQKTMEPGISAGKGTPRGTAGLPANLCDLKMQSLHS